VSNLHADRADDLGYDKGKHEIEETLRETSIPHAIVRPVVLFGRSDILVNNIAWVLRHLPIFGVFGDGTYWLRPIHAEDMADLLIERGHSVLVQAGAPRSSSDRKSVV